MSDEGPCVRGETFQTNGVSERFFGALEYGHLYRVSIADPLAVGINLFRQTENTPDRIKPSAPGHTETPT